MSTHKGKNCDIKWLGEPKGHLGVGNPKVLLFCINIGELEGIRDFFPDRFVRVWCKKNYFLLHKEITSFLLEKDLWKVSNVVLWICWMLNVECELFCSCYECALVYSMKFPLWVMNVVHKQLAIWFFIYL